MSEGKENNLISFLNEQLPSKYRHVIDFASKLGVKLRTEAEIVTSPTAAQPTIGKKRKSDDADSITENTDVRKFRSSAMQTSTVEITELDSLINVCNRSIFNVSAKKEEFEKKVQLGLKLWEEQKENRNGPWNFGLFYCYDVYCSSSIDS